MNFSSSLSLRKHIVFVTLSCATMIAIGCSKEKIATESTLEQAMSKKAQVTNQGKTIVFDSQSPSLNHLKSVVARSGETVLALTSPARVVASISSSADAGGKFVLFENQDNTSLFSQYRQAKANVLLSSKNLERVKDMFSNQGATMRDVNQAENDVAIARSELAEMQGKLRAVGYSPRDLEATADGTVWVIADVPESQLREVQHGEQVTVYFASMTDKKFHGRADAIGDVIDPITRTVKVRVSLPNNDKVFRPGMFCKVDFTDEQPNILTIPYTAVVTVDSKEYVFIRTGKGNYERRLVNLSRANQHEAQVHAGISNGEEVVVEGAMLLKGLSFGY